MFAFAKNTVKQELSDIFPSLYKAGVDLSSYEVRIKARLKTTKTAYGKKTSWHSIDCAKGRNGGKLYRVQLSEALASHSSECCTSRSFLTENKDRAMVLKAAHVAERKLFEVNTLMDSLESPEQIAALYQDLKDARSRFSNLEEAFTFMGVDCHIGDFFGLLIDELTEQLIVLGIPVAGITVSLPSRTESVSV